MSDTRLCLTLILSLMMNMALVLWFCSPPRGAPPDGCTRAHIRWERGVNTWVCDE